MPAARARDPPRGRAVARSRSAQLAAEGARLVSVRREKMMSGRFEEKGISSLEAGKCLRLYGGERACVPVSWGTGKGISASA